MNIFLIGAPGCGKGTQSEFLVHKKNFQHLSTGNIFRHHLKNETPLGLSAKKYMKEGKLVPDGITIDMVKDSLASIDNQQNLVFDGFPRNLKQAQAFDKILDTSHRQLDWIFYLEVSDAKIIERLAGRLYAPKSGRVYHKTQKPPQKEGFCDESGEELAQREDDKEEVILKRLKIFWEDTRPLLDYYKEKFTLKTLDGEKSPEDIFQDILSIISS